MFDPRQSQWYYIGFHGQLGPLTFADVEDLIENHVITPETHVWCGALPDWTPAGNVPELGPYLPMSVRSAPPQPSALRPSYPQSYGPPQSGQVPPSWELNSTRNRTTAGLLNFIPGVGRLYLGYTGLGLAQLLTFIFCGVGLIWAWIDALIILTGGVNFDADGRRI